MNRRSWRGTVGAMAAVGVLACAGTAAAGTTQVRGVQTPFEDHYRMAGDLVGDWYFTSFESKGVHPSGTIQATGTERFEGCLDADRDTLCGSGDPRGTLSFSYQTTLKFDLTTFRQILGRCHHPVTAGTGDFAGATGSLDFIDDPATGCSYFRGHLTLG